MRRSITIWAVAIVAMVACQQNRDNDYTNIGDNSVKFISTDINSRVTQMDQGDGVVVDAWEVGDKIGITSSGFDSDYTNVEYVATAASTSTTTSFEAVDSDSTITSSSESGEVSFYAYYPYTSSLYEGGEITINIKEQRDDIGAVDFMTTSHAVDFSTYSASDEIDLSFTHRLTKVIFNITAKNEMDDIQSIDAALVYFSTTANYDLNGGQIERSLSGNDDSIDVTSVIGDDSRSATVTAIIHPGNYSSAANLPYLELTINGNAYGVWLTSDDYTLYANTIHSFNVSLGSNSEVITEGSSIEPWESVAGDDQTPTKEVWSGDVATTFNGVAFSINQANYQITTGEELAYLAQLVDDENDLDGYTFTLENNIDLNDISWTPIGDGYTFNGTFDGGGYKIKRLYATKSGWDLGLFYTLGEYGTIKNLSVEGNLTASANCAGIVAMNEGGTVDNCSFDGTITATNYGQGSSGGIVGNNNFGIITNCYNKGTIKGTYSGGTESIGGIVGSSRGDKSYMTNASIGLVYACYNMGEVYSTGDLIGGIVGYNMEGAIIESCFNIGNIEGNRQVGGIAGYNTDSEVRSVYNKGAITANSSVSGVVGISEDIQNEQSYDALVIYAYNTGVVISNDDYCVGGVIGLNHTLASYCYALEDTESDYYVDGSYTYIVVNSSSDATVSDIESMSESTMKSDMINNLGDAFEDDYSDNVNGGYPILKAIDYTQF